MTGTVLDVFKGDAFSLTSMTASINKVPFKPGRIGSMGLYHEQGVSTTSIQIEEKGGVLRLLQTKQRGETGTKHSPGKRKARSLKIPHIPTEDEIFADEIQNVRAFGSTNQLQGVKQVVDERLGEMASNIDVTLERLKLSGIKGIILDADDSEIYNLYDEFNVEQIEDVDFDLANPEAKIKDKCSKLIRGVSYEMGGMPFTHLHALCGDDFFDALIEHPEVKDAYERWQDGAMFRGSQVYQTFEYGGIVWENYKGYLASKPFIETDKCHFVPMGAPGLFKLYYAPADYVETVNTVGLPRYAKQSIDPKFQKFVAVEAQSNPLPLCTMPRALVGGIADAG